MNTWRHFCVDIVGHVFKDFSVCIRGERTDARADDYGGRRGEPAAWHFNRTKGDLRKDPPSSNVFLQHKCQLVHSKTVFYASLHLLRGFKLLSGSLSTARLNGLRLTA